MTNIKALLHALHMSFTERQLDALENVVLLLVKWNRVYNLIGTDDVKEIVIKYIADSLSIKDYLHGERIVDIGTGAGFPGIPLAIMTPQKQFVLLDSSGKKMGFVRQVIAALNLHNVEAMQVRAEDFSSDTGFDSVLTRAFASIYAMLKVTQHLVGANGYFLAMKGKQPTVELQALPDEFVVEAVHPLQVPRLDAARCLVMIKRKTR